MNDSLIRTLVAAAKVKQSEQRYSVQTPDATPTTIVTFTLDSNTGGILEVTIVGKDDGGTGSVTGKSIVRYDKTVTLTLGTPVDILPLETDIVGATYSISAVSDNIEIVVTGAATVINWTVETKLINEVATNTP